MLDSEGEEATSSGLHALDSAYPPIHQWALENAAAIWSIAEVDLTGPIFKDSLSTDAPNFDELVHLEGHPITDAAVSTCCASPVGDFTPGYERLIPHHSLKPM